MKDPDLKAIESLSTKLSQHQPSTDLMLEEDYNES